MATTLQPLSDLHLEFYGHHPPPLTIVGDYVALCGDIGRPRMENYAALLKELSEKCKGVLVVLGNHELYAAHHTHQDTVDVATRLCATFPNVYLLHNRSVTLEGVRFLGCTLWSHVPNGSFATVRAQINDYRCIRMYSEQRNRKLPITPLNTNDWHQRSVEWLESELQADTTTPTVVLTHHPPVPSRDNHPCYGTDLRERLLKCSFTVKRARLPNRKNWISILLDPATAHIVMFTAVHTGAQVIAAAIVIVLGVLLPWPLFVLGLIAWQVLLPDIEQFRKHIRHRAKEYQQRKPVKGLFVRAFAAVLSRTTPARYHWGLGFSLFHIVMDEDTPIYLLGLPCFVWPFAPEDALVCAAIGEWCLAVVQR